MLLSRKPTLCLLYLSLFLRLFPVFDSLPRSLSTLILNVRFAFPFAPFLSLLFVNYLMRREQQGSMGCSHCDAWTRPDAQWKRLIETVSRMPRGRPGNIEILRV